MSVVRIEKSSNYTCINNNPFKDKELSLKARGLLVTVLTLPDDWSYSIEGLVSILKESRVVVTGTLNELKDAGYLKVDKLLPESKDGKVVRSRIEYVYTFYEQKQEHQIQELQNQGLESQVIEKGTELNNKISSNKESNNKNKKNSKLSYLDHCSQILLEYDFSVKVMDKIVEYLTDRAKLKDNQLRTQLELLAKLSEGEQLESLTMAIGGGWKMMCYPKSQPSRSRRSNDPMDEHIDTQAKVREDLELRERLQEDPKSRAQLFTSDKKY